MSDDRRQVGSSIAWMAMGNWIEQAFNILIFVILARLLGVEVFGIVAMATAIVVLCEFLVRETLTEYLVAAPVEDRAHNDAVFYSLCLFSAALFAALWGASDIFALFYKREVVADLIKVLGISVLFVGVGAVPASLLRRHMRFKSLAVRAIVGVAAGGVVAIWMAFQGYGVWSLVAQRLVQVGTNTILAWAAVTWRPRLAFDAGTLRDTLKFGSGVVALRGAQIARVQVPMALIGALLGPVVLGYFSLAWRLVEIASFLVSTPIRMVSQSAFAARLREGRPAKNLLIELSRLTSWIAFPAVFGMIVLAHPIVGLVFGAKWQLSAQALSILGFVAAYLALEMVHQSYCLAAVKIRHLTYVAWTEVGLAAIAIIVTSRFGLIGVSFGFTGSFIALWMVRFSIVSRLAGVPTTTLLAQHVAPFLAGGVMALVVGRLALVMPGLPDLALVTVSVLVGMVLYGAFCMVFMRDRLNLARQYLGGA